MNRSVYLGLSIPELSKILMYEFWYDYVKLYYDEKERLCYMDKDSCKKVSCEKVVKNFLVIKFLVKKAVSKTRFS